MESLPAHNGKVALVTGAARGIGLGIAAWLIAEGWQVVLADIDRARGSKVAKALGSNAWFVGMDVAHESQVAVGIAEVLGQFGRLDALVCNAGVAEAHGAPLESLELMQWNRTLSVNLTGPMLLAKHCAPYLRGHRGAIVTIASTRAHQSERDTEAYAASKGGLVALTHALAISLGPDIRVNVVSPGWIDSATAPPVKRRRCRNGIMTSTRRAASVRWKTSPPWSPGCFRTTAASSPARSSWSTAA